MTFILISNDDGIDSPALPALVRALVPVADRVEVVVPDGERSWISKAITRHDDVRVREVTIEGIRMTATSGSPADSVQLGVHNLFDRRPDLVVSGINIGSNYGSAFTMGSGTVGAAFEAAISGISSIALSATSQGEPFRDWAARMRHPESVTIWDRLAAVSREIVSDVLEHGMGEETDVLSVNMPDHATSDTPRRVTALADTRYSSLFQRHGDNLYRHDWTANTIDHRGKTDGTDVHTARQGFISITPLRLAGLGHAIDHLAEVFHRP